MRRTTTQFKKLRNRRLSSARHRPSQHSRRYRQLRCERLEDRRLLSAGAEQLGPVDISPGILQSADVNAAPDGIGAMTTGPSPSVSAAVDVDVKARMEIFAAGHLEPLSDGELPLLVPLPEGTTSVQFAPEGTIKAGGAYGWTGPDGYPGRLSEFIGPLGGISAVRSPRIALMGVFLGSGKPADGTEPPPLDFANPPTGLGTDFVRLEPEPRLQQTFFIGDGERPSGQQHAFEVPPGATRLFLGFADSNDFAWTTPGFYFDTEGTLDVDITFLNPLRVVATDPAPSSVISELVDDQIVITFSSPPDLDTVNENTVHLTRSGGDAIFGNGNDVEITPKSVTMINPTQARVDLAGIALGGDKYQLRLDAGTSLHFDGGDVVRVAPSTTIEVTESLTIEAWIYPTAPSHEAIIVNKEGEYELARFEDGTIAWALANADPGWGSDWIFTGAVAPPNVWTHVALTYDGGTIRTYLDGKLEHSLPGSGAIGDVHSDLDDLWIGGRQHRGSGSFVGMIDEVRVWNVARGQLAIQEDIDHRLSGAEAGLAGYWVFNEGDGQTANDLSAHGNHGMLGLSESARSDDPAWAVPGAPLPGIADAADNPLDGEFPTSTLPSGNGMPGGDFVTYFSVKPDLSFL